MNNNSQIVLTVPQHEDDPTNVDILAIDGILYSDNNILHHKIITQGNSKILMEGYLKNVQLRGNLRISDLLLESTGDVIMNTNPLSYETSGGLYFEGSAYSSEIYGKVILRDNGSVNNAIIEVSSGKLSLMPGAEIHLNGSQDLYLIGGETHLQSATGIYAVATEPYKQIHVLSGAKLIVDENAKVEIYPTIIVEDGGEVDLMNHSITQLAHFWIKPGGTFHIFPGAYMIFLPNPMIIVNMVNACQGNFIAEGTEQDSIFIYGPSDFCHPTPDHPIKVNDRQCINFFGDESLNYKSVHIQYCSFENVDLYANDVMFWDGSDPTVKIEHNRFAFDKTLSCYNNNPPYLLSIYSSNNTINSVSNMWSAAINDNLFLDYDGLRRNEPRIDAIGNGLSVVNYANISMSINTFEFIKYQTYLDNNGWAMVGTGNNFISTTIGVLSDNNNTCLLLCNNFSDNEHGYLLYNTYSQAYGNTFSNSRLAINNFSNNISFVIGNIFDTYLDGILINNGYVYVGRDGDGFRLGNSFNNLRSNNHYPLSNQNGILDVADISYIQQSGAYIWLGNHLCVYNGRNLFNSNVEDRNYHFEVQKSTVSHLLDVTSNKFPRDINNICTPRTRLDEVFTHGFDLCHNEEGLYDCQTLLMVSGGFKLPPPPDIPPDTTSTTIPFSTGGGCMDSSNFSKDGWTYYNSTGNINDSLHNDAEWSLSWLMYNTADTSIASYCRFQNAQMAYHCILLGNQDSISNRLNYLYGLFSDFMTRNYPEDIMSHFYNLSAQIFNKINQYNLALSYLNNIVNNYPGTEDSIPAAWEIQRINAYLSDTTMGHIYDSLMYEYQNRVVQDLRRFPLAVIDSMQPFRNAVSFDYKYNAYLGQNIPNPFEDETEIPYSLTRDANIKLTVIDVFGRVVEVLVSGSQSAGKHSAIFKTTGYDNGIYFYKLETPSIVLTKKMVLIR